MKHLCSLFQFSISFWFDPNSLFTLPSLYEFWWDFFGFFFPVSSSWYFAWLGLPAMSFFFFSFFAIYIYLPFFPTRLDCFDGIKHSIASMQLNASRHGKLSTAVNSIHFPLHPSCLLFLPVTLSITGFRCRLYCENLARKKKVKMESAYEKWLWSRSLGK